MSDRDIAPDDLAIRASEQVAALKTRLANMAMDDDPDAYHALFAELVDAEKRRRRLLLEQECLVGHRGIPKADVRRLRPVGDQDAQAAAGES